MAVLERRLRNPVNGFNLDGGLLKNRQFYLLIKIKLLHGNSTTNRRMLFSYLQQGRK